MPLTRISAIPTTQVWSLQIFYFEKKKSVSLHECDTLATLMQAHQCGLIFFLLVTDNIFFWKKSVSLHELTLQRNFVQGKKAYFYFLGDWKSHRLSIFFVGTSFCTHICKKKSDLSNLKRMLSLRRNFWKFLDTIQIVSQEAWFQSKILREPGLNFLSMNMC